MPESIATSATEVELSEIDRSRYPKHIAVIMDGNGRWAQRQGLPRIEGHRRGVSSVRRVTEESARLGIQQLTLYCLSSENWKRPQHEIDFLMHLLEQYMVEERQLMMNHNIQVVVIGRRSGIPASTLAEVDKTIAMTAGNTGMRLCLAINYGGRSELLDTMQAVAFKIQSGELSPEALTEQTISDHLYTSGMPDPDLIIRTAGEMRLSNFLLWQLSYAEIWVAQNCWPDFSLADLHQAIYDFAHRNRRFGGLVETA